MLRGSLNDLSVVDLVQIPLGNGRTGELLIATEDQDARLYYVDGRLIHAVSGEERGPAALDAIVSWTDGEFEFRPGILSDDANAEFDLNTELASTVDRYRIRVFVKAAGESADRVRRLLVDFLSSNDSAVHASLLYRNGTVIASGTDRVEDPAWLESVRSSVLDIIESYPRKGLNRVLFEDDEGTLVVACYPEGQSALLVAAKRGATLGAVSIAVDRLARKIGHVNRAR